MFPGTHSLLFCHIQHLVHLAALSKQCVLQKASTPWHCQHLYICLLMIYTVQLHKECPELAVVIKVCCMSLQLPIFLPICLPTFQQHFEQFTLVDTWRCSRHWKAYLQCFGCCRSSLLPANLLWFLATSCHHKLVLNHQNPVGHRVFFVHFSITLLVSFSNVSHQRQLWLDFLLSVRFFSHTTEILH